MRRILRTILFLAVLCLTGCSEEVPQNVAFDKEQVSVFSQKNSFELGIQADCPWVLHLEKGNFTVTKASGEGSTTIHVSVKENNTYEDTEHILEIYSENRKSSDRLIINQHAKLETSVQQPSMLPCEGGEFEVKIKSSDTLSDIETPDWITFKSSRAMEDYVYTFTAEPNKTGIPRTGKVWLKGLLKHEDFDVKQDSYAPTGVVVEDMPENTTDSEIDVKISLEPSYADWGKIKAEASDDATAFLTEGLLKLSMNTYGIHTFSIRHKTSDMTGIDGNGLLFSSAIERFPEKIFRGSATRNLYIGEGISLKTNYDSDEYVMFSSNENVAKIQEDGSILATGKGSASISITHPDLDVKDSVEVNVNRVRFAAWMDTYLNWGASWTIYIYATIEGANITKAAFATGDYKQAVVFPQGVRKKEFDKGVNYVTYDCTISVMVNSVEELKERLNHIKVEFSGIVDGEEVMETVTVLPEKP